jgi:hypothetical protein
MMQKSGVGFSYRCNRRRDWSSAKHVILCELGVTLILLTAHASILIQDLHLVIFCIWSRSTCNFFQYNIFYTQFESMLHALILHQLNCAPTLQPKQTCLNESVCMGVPARVSRLRSLAIVYLFLINIHKIME